MNTKFTVIYSTRYHTILMRHVELLEGESIEAMLCRENLHEAAEYVFAGHITSVA